MHAPTPQTQPEYRFLTGDCLAHLKTFNDNSIDCVVTSPPYFGLRDYGTASWTCRESNCEHLAPAAHGYAPFETSTLGANRDGISADNSAHAPETKRHQFRGVCKKCGATRVDQQIGLEQTPSEFVNKLVEVFSEVRRVLKPSGTCWLNLGDSYARAVEKGGSGPGGKNEDRWGYGSAKSRIKNSNSKQASNAASDIDGIARHLTIGSSDGAVGRADRPGSRSIGEGLKFKDLIGIPWRVAFALQSSGWYLRQDIIWHKPNPMPESVRDRCTKAHEYLFMLTKSEKYFYDADAVAEPVTASTIARVSQANLQNQKGSDRVPGKTNGNMKAVVRKQDGHGRRHAGFNARFFAQEESSPTRNRRSVWTITTKPFKEAHFATFPPDLVEPCILAGCPPNGIVLDPFSGAGTTVLVANKLNRHAIGIELNPAYNEIAERRLQTSRNCGT